MTETCSWCGDPIGAYEPIWWRHPDGRDEPCGLLAVRERAVDDEDHELLHHRCYLAALESVRGE